MLADLASLVLRRPPAHPLLVASSFVPVTAPVALMLRLAVPPGPPLRQLLLSGVMPVGVAAMAVWSPALIFRVGLLMQAPSPTPSEPTRWMGWARREPA